MAAPPPPPKGGGMSLYANLLNPKADPSATVSGAPVVYDNGEKEDASVKKDAVPALRFQPIRRPQINQKKPAIKPSFPKSIPSAANNNNNSNNSNNTASIAVSRDVSGTSSPAAPGDAPPPAPAQRSTLADWAATEEDEYMYGAAAAAEKRQRGGRRAKKKNKSRQSEGQRGTDWDEIYDPSRPTNVDEYLRSDERVREVQEWKSVLYAHRRKLRKGSYDSEEDDSEGDARPAMGNQFAPPGDYSFAPPPMSPQARTQATHPPPPQTHPPPPQIQPPPPPPPPDDATGDDAFARRLAMSQGIAPPPPPPPPPQEEPSGASIARAPVRYEAPPRPPQTTERQDDDEDTEMDDAAPLGLGASNNDNDNDQTMPDADDNNNNNTPRTNRPGQKGFAQRLMSKYGWTAGSGLGAEQTGIVNPLQVKVEKRRRRPDAEGGGFAEPGGRARIIGGKVAAATAADKDKGKFGAMSEVIVLRNMLEGMENLQGEIESGLGQEIGEECGEKYGRVERLYIDVEGRQVFIKFTDQVSALRAVNALEGRVFNGNTIAARFWDAEDFEKGVYC
ncbi:hypothetical protein SLS53_003476 [Cytospora paraplurivora]|uniref:G-patch domain-containing protein n=1 Tax=Cytospora paraplurivora TaxID=2898453 RepID=A0AAN9YJE6_9PEZI